MRYFIKYSLICCLLLYMSCDNSGPAYITNPTPMVVLSASTESIVVTESVSIEISGENLSNIFGISFEISYDPIYIELVASPDLNDYSSSATGSDFIGPVTHSNITEGIFSFAMSGSAIDGSIYTISFTGKSAGQSPITLGKVHLIQNDGSDISNFNSFSLPDPVIITVSENE